MLLVMCDVYYIKKFSLLKEENDKIKGMKEYTVNQKESGQTLEKYIKKVLNTAPLSFIYKLFRKKDIKVDGHWQKEKYIISAGEEISIYLSDDQLEDFKKQKVVEQANNISTWIIYEDANIILINKPRGVLVQKADKGDYALDDMVLSYLKEKGEYEESDVFSPAPVHRLDRNTAGIIIFAKNLRTAQYLNNVINDKNVILKEYLALVRGHISSEGIVDAPLLKKVSHVEVDCDLGKEAVTKYNLVKYVGDYSLVNIALLTGRTHQIRVHMSYINHPLIGDKKYGDYVLNKKIEEKYHFKNQFLVAYKLSFYNIEGELSYLANKTFEVELPPDCKELISIFEHK